MYWVYAIKNLNHDWIYVGLTNNLTRRLQEHNRGKNLSTKHYAPFELIYSEQKENRVLAREKEKKLKTSSGKNFLRKIYLASKEVNCAGLSTCGDR